MTPAKIGKYSVVRSVGARGEGLYLGEHGSRRVIIRVPAENQAEASEEARKIAALSHPSITPQEVGLFDDQVFLASEVGSASTLEEWLSKGGSLGEQLRVVEAIADALGYVHGQGVLHRALKPANVVMGGEGCRLANFGLTSSAAALGDDATVYGAPEVLEGMPDTAQSDIYSAGVLFYEVLAGRREEARDGRVAKPLREIRPDLSRDVADAVTACRERSPDWRPKDLSYLLEVVRRARGSTGAAAPRAAAPRAPARAAAAPTGRRSAGPTFATRRPARSPMPILIAIGVVLVGGAAAWFLTQGSGGGAGPAPATPTTVSTTPPATTMPSQGETPPGPTPATNGGKTATATGAPTPGPITPVTTMPVTTMPALPSPAPEVKAATPRPVATLPAATLPPPTTAPPTTLAQVEAPPPVSEGEGAPLVLTAVSPPLLKRGARTLVDVRGTGMRGGLQPSLLRGKSPAESLRVVSQRFVNPTLIQVFFEVDAAAPTGTYTLSLGDERGVSNSVRFDVK